MWRRGTGLCGFKFSSDPERLTSRLTARSRAQFEHFIDENAGLESLLVRFDPNKVCTHPARTTNCNKVAESNISVGRIVKELES